MKKQDAILLISISFLIFVILVAVTLNATKTEQKIQKKDFSIGRTIIKIQVPRESTGSTIIEHNDCLSYAKENWESFDFQIDENSANCRIEFLRIYKLDDYIELHCGCTPST